LIHTPGVLAGARYLVKSARIGRSADAGVSAYHETGKDWFPWFATHTGMRGLVPNYLQLATWPTA
jgi:hypothetical protein